MYASAAALVLGPLRPSITPGSNPAFLRSVCASETLLVVVDVCVVSLSGPSVNLTGSLTSSNFCSTSFLSTGLPLEVRPLLSP